MGFHPQECEMRQRAILRRSSILHFCDDNHNRLAICTAPNPDALVRSDESSSQGHSGIHSISGNIVSRQLAHALFETDTFQCKRGNSHTSKIHHRARGYI